ncbi:MAG: thioredoxin family protein [Agathobaculum sp.]|jgi:thioredoxin 1|uniref:thioredoxin family protein n=1 Tax=Agathobaculum sp. TaxID=2048138 RepID=UPI003D8DFBE8
MAAINMNQELFEEMRSGSTPLLVDFWAPWCGYCRRISAPYDKIAEEYSGRLTVGKVNVDEQAQLAAAEQIEVLPTLVLYRNGEAIDSIVAPTSKAMIDEFIRNALTE